MPIPGVGPDARLARYLRREVGAHSSHYAPVLTRARGSGQPWGRAVLTEVRPARLDDLPEPDTLVLRPAETTLLRAGDRALAARLALARLLGRQARWGRTVIDPLYKPVRWTYDGGLLVGWSAGDVARLAELGRRWLEGMGVVPDDVVVGLLPTSARLAHSELSLGARRAGLSAIHLGPGADPHAIARLRPTVIVGEPDELLRITGAADLRHVRVAVVVASLLSGEVRARLQAALAPDAFVAWTTATPGTRSVWWECRPGGGLHTAPDADVVESVDGEIVWSPLDWRGTVVLRLRTGLVGEIDADPCPACRRPGVLVLAGPARPRRDPDAVVKAPPAPTPSADMAETDLEEGGDAIEVDDDRIDAILDLLDADERVETFLLEADGHAPPVVFLALAPGGHPGPVLRELDRRIGAAEYVVLSSEEIDDRIDACGGELVTPPPR